MSVKIPFIFLAIFCCPFVGVSGQFTNESAKQQSEDETRIANLQYSTVKVTWNVAATECSQQVNGSLLPVTTQTETKLFTAIRNKYHHDGVWVGDYKVLDKTFVPQRGAKLSPTDKCVALTITSINKNGNDYGIMYELNVQSICSHSYAAMCVCKSGLSKTLKVTTQLHSWSYQSSNCGTRCSLWNPPFDHVTPGDFQTVVGTGNVTLRGLSVHLQTGKTYWVNVLARLLEKPSIGSIIECGYISSFVNSIGFGTCDEKRAFICESAAGTGEVTTATPEITTKSTAKDEVPTVTDVHNLEHNDTTIYLQTQNENSKQDGLSVGQFAGIIGGSVMFVVCCIVIIVAWIKCRRQRDGKNQKFSAKGGRSFIRQKSSSQLSEDKAADSKDDNRMTLYAKIDSARVRNTLPTARGINSKQPDIILTATGYLPMDNFKKSTSHDNYDVIDHTGRGLHGDGDYVEVDECTDSLYSVSRISSHPDDDTESVYDTTLDRHPSQRQLITDNTYARLDMSMEGNMCNSINMEDNNYSNHRNFKVINPTYDRLIIK